MPKLPYAENSRVMRYGYEHCNSSKSAFILEKLSIQRASISKFYQYYILYNVQILSD